jgi:sec-independent protein translocase protein TatA
VFGSLGTPEILLILLIILLLFGAKKIPEVMRGLGQGLREFRRATREATDEFERLTSAEPEPAPTKPAANAGQAKPAASAASSEAGEGDKPA